VRCSSSGGGGAPRPTRPARLAGGPTRTPAPRTPPRTRRTGPGGRRGHVVAAGDKLRLRAATRRERDAEGHPAEATREVGRLEARRTVVVHPGPTGIFAAARVELRLTAPGSLLREAWCGVVVDPCRGAGVEVIPRGDRVRPGPRAVLPRLVGGDVGELAPRVGERPARLGGKRGRWGGSEEGVGRG